MDNKQIANTILQQLGGSGRVSSMLGAKNFAAIESGLQFRWAAKAKNKANFINIKLNGNDLYDITFIRVYGLNLTEISEHNDVYAEDLISLFETQTGLYLHF